MFGEEPKHEPDPQWEKFAPLANALLNFAIRADEITNAVSSKPQKGNEE